MSNIIVINKYSSNSVTNYITASDEELFEDNPEEYIRRDIEGSGMYTDDVFYINSIIL